MCLPFFGKKQRKRLTPSEQSLTEDYTSQRSSISRLERSASYSPTATLTSHPASQAEKLTFDSETESFNLSRDYHAARDVTPVHPVLKRSNTAATRSKSGTKKWGFGHGWGTGQKDKERQQDREKALLDPDHESTPPPLYQHTGSVDMQSRSYHSSRTQSNRSSFQDQGRPTAVSFNPIPGGARSRSQSTGGSGKGVHPFPQDMLKRSETYKSNMTRSTTRSGRPTLYPSESSSTLVGSALERKMRDEDAAPVRQDTASRLEALRDHMRQHELAY